MLRLQRDRWAETVVVCAAVVTVAVFVEVLVPVGIIVVVCLEVRVLRSMTLPVTRYRTSIRHVNLI